MTYESFLHKEMLSAFGCTEPIALAYAAAYVADTLDEQILSLDAICSANIIKNVKSVIIPNSGGKRSVEVACALGAVSKNHLACLEVLNNISNEQRELANELAGRIKVHLQEGVENLYIRLIARSINGNEAEIILEKDHSNVTYLRRNETVLINNPLSAQTAQNSEISLEFSDIYKWCTCEDLSGIKELLDQQIKLNMAIAKEGLANQYGANIGKIYLAQNTPQSAAIAHAAAASDARMSGCCLPVVINSGSGNQGITVSVPVIFYAEQINAPKEQLYKALALSNLCAFYLKKGIGKLSAYCGVVSAASAAICGIALLDGASKEIIERALINSLATVSGILCDGAKPSCAGKIAAALQAAFIGYEQAKSGNNFNFDDGIIKNDLASTVKAISKVAKDGMAQTDVVILQEMIKQADEC